MEFLLGVQQRSTADAWCMTLREYDLALAGHNRFHGGDATPDIDVSAMRSFIDEMKAQYPDNPA